MYEESSTGMESNSANDFGERLMNLPFELKQKILYSLTPKERCHLRLVNKAMLDAVDASMSDVQKIDVEFAERCKPHSPVVITTANPYSDAEKRHVHKTVPSSSLPFLLKWTGAQLKTLDLAIYTIISEEDDSPLKPFYQVFKALNSENICPKLSNLSLDMEESLWDSCEIILSDLLNYITKRQLQAMVTDRPTPFLHSLTFTNLSKSILYKTSTVDPLHCEKRRKFLQDIFDQCHGLKELDVEDLLVLEDLPIVTLRYPTTLTRLYSDRHDEAPGMLQALVSNCPNLLIVRLYVGFPRDDAEVHALASLSDLRELELKVCATEEKMAWLTAQCLAAFKDYPFGASIARPWRQLKSVKLDCYKYDDYVFLKYRLLLSGVNCCITSLHLTWCPYERDAPYAHSVEQLFKALNSKDACPNLMELNVDCCELVFRIADSLATTEDRKPQALEQQSDDSCDDLLIIPVPTPLVYGLLNDLLAYVTKRQSEVRLGKPFLRSLSAGIDDCGCYGDEAEYDDVDKLRDQLKQIHATIQQILDQCHGLEVLYMESLNDYRINPNKKKGLELVKLVALRFPKTLKKLNGSCIDNYSNNL